MNRYINLHLFSTLHNVCRCMYVCIYKCERKNEKEPFTIIGTPEKKYYKPENKFRFTNMSTFIQCEYNQSHIKK